MSGKRDTHGVDGDGWIGFDLDGTLAVYDDWNGIDHIGAPVKPMVDLMKRLHGEGKAVKIFTARVAARKDGSEEKVNGRTARQYIEEWCDKHLGFVPEITNVKDQLMLECYDDRARQVVPNKGVLVEDVLSRVKRAFGGMFGSVEV